MEITYIYGNVLVDRLLSRPCTSQSTEIVGNFHKWKKSHKRKSGLIGLTITTSLFISKNHFFTLFSRIKLFFFFSLVQTTKLNLKLPTTLQQPCTDWLAPTMRFLVNAKTDLDNFFGPKLLWTTWT